MQQIKLSSTPDADEIARRKQMEDDLAQIKHDLAVVKARLEMTNQPAARP